MVAWIFEESLLVGDVGEARHGTGGVVVQDTEAHV